MNSTEAREKYQWIIIWLKFITIEKPITSDIRYLKWCYRPHVCKINNSQVILSWVSVSANLCLSAWYICYIHWLIYYWNISSCSIWWRTQIQQLKNSILCRFTNARPFSLHMRFVLDRKYECHCPTIMGDLCHPLSTPCGYDSSFILLIGKGQIHD